MLSLFLEEKRSNGWIQARSLKESLEILGKLVDVNIKNPNLMLIKFSMKIKALVQKILQWENKCKRQHALLYRDSHAFAQLSLIKTFKKLSPENCHPWKAFRNLLNGCYATETIALVKKFVASCKRNTVEKKFTAHGLVMKKNKVKEWSRLWPFRVKKIEPSFSILNEWFSVLRRNVDNTLRIIDTVCNS